MEFNFETKIKELNEIVLALESDQYNLEDSLKNYKKGSEISKEIQKYLENIKKEIELQNQQTNGIDDIN
ncbi:MAG: exodeoxyribonuclease VII small subunit [Lactobacillaceae bacterium]|jgi:exodeoxyribonuclease VII small subunit|nr:exodeoxyribonuclease VII small subunit [Lactobacillaceae bacterium]